MKYIEKALELIFLPSCGICGKLGEGYLCKKCGKSLEEYKILKIEINSRKLEKSNNDSNSNSKYEDYIEKLFLYEYKDIIRQKMIQYKFNDKSYLYKLFCELILKDKKTCEFINSYDIIIPVPVHKKKKIKRGYNQCELITRELSKKLKINTYNNILIKKNNNKTQSTLNKNERTENVKDAYKVINIDKIKDKRILIFDDIYTTGSTINECIRVLKIAGIEKIGVLILAKD